MEKKIDRTMCKTCPKIVNCVSNNLVCVKRYNELEAENETIRKFLEEVEDQVCSVTTELLNDDLVKALLFIKENVDILTILKNKIYQEKQISNNIKK